MLRKQTLLIILALLILPLWAQQEQDVQLEEVIELNQLGLINTNGLNGQKQTPVAPVVAQMDEYRSLFPAGIPEIGNSASVIQQGNHNSASITMTGDRNSFGLLQNGNNNDYEGAISGEENLLRVFQLGNNNFISQDLSGNNMEMEIIQQGNNHELIHIDNSGLSPAYQINQTGNNGMRIIIENDQVW